MRIVPMKGYNFITRSAINCGDAKEFRQKLSIIEFLRRIKVHELKPGEYTVFGLSELFTRFGCSVEQISQLLLDILNDSSVKNRLDSSGSVVQFIINGELVTGRYLSMRVEEQEIPLTPIFGTMLKQLGKNHYHAGFSIS
ncbi:MAG: hypothetical protein ACE5PV_27360 [Candidatus Poribacteria bacterium]